MFCLVIVRCTFIILLLQTTNGCTSRGHDIFFVSLHLPCSFFSYFIYLVCFFHLLCSFLFICLVYFSSYTLIFLFNFTYLVCFSSSAFNCFSSSSFPYFIYRVCFATIFRLLYFSASTSFVSLHRFRSFCPLFIRFVCLHLHDCFFFCVPLHLPFVYFSTSTSFLFLAASIYIYKKKKFLH